MSGLGARGQNKASAPVNELFRKTDNVQNSKCVEVQIQQDKTVRKQYVLSYELSEKLRELAYKERRKEVDIVRQALEEYFRKYGNQLK